MIELLYEPSRQVRHHTHPKHLFGISALPAEKRHAFCLKETVARRETWGLCRGRHWALIPDMKNGSTAFALWPTWEYAEDWLGQHTELWHRDFAPRSITLRELLDELLPLLEEEDLSIGSFYLPENQGITIKPTAFKQEILRLMINWFGDANY